MIKDELREIGYADQWQRLAVKELSMILAELGGGTYLTVDEYCDRLCQAIANVKDYDFYRRTMPSSRAEINRLGT